MKHLKTFESSSWFDYPSDNQIKRVNTTEETTIYNVSHISSKDAYKGESYDNLKDAYDRATRGYSVNEYCVFETKCRVMLDEEVGMLLNTDKFNL